jgi:Helicase conserved C-terminal domain/SNF2-related domain
MESEQNLAGVIDYSKLNEDSPQILQPSRIKVELKQHQKAAIHSMVELERRGYVDANFRYYSNKERLLRIESQIGILNDRVGSGKTLILTSLLVENPTTTIRPYYYASDNYTTIREIDMDGQDLNDYQYAPINIVIVPKGIHHQWSECFDDQVDDFNYVSLLDATERPNIIDLVDPHIESGSSDIITIICNDTTVQWLFTKYSGKMFNRIIIDEADTLKFSTLKTARAAFIWLVTGTTNGIPYSNKKYIKEIFGKNISWQPDFLTIKNSEAFIQKSMALPTPNRIVIPCKTPHEIVVLGKHIPKDVMNMINAGNIEQATRRLNCQMDTADNIYKVIANNYERAIKNKTIELDAEKKKKYKSDKRQAEHAKLIRKLEKVIETLKNKQDSLKRSIFESDGKICPICLTSIEELNGVHMTMLDCCGCKYCFTCITSIIASNGHKCPACMRKISTKNMHVIEAIDSDSDSDTDSDTDTDSDSDSDTDSDSDADSESKSKVKRMHRAPKMDTLLAILSGRSEYDPNNNKIDLDDRRFLIFADYNETFERIRKELKKLKIRYGILTGGGKKVQQTVDDFRKGKISVIMLNAQNFGAGLNLQCATDIVMFHRFTQRMEEQIIGRGQRMGRDGTLNVYYLIHDNERDVRGEVENPQEFNDFDYQEYLETLE